MQDAMHTPLLHKATMAAAVGLAQVQRLSSSDQALTSRGMMLLKLQTGLRGLGLP